MSTSSARHQEDYRWPSRAMPARQDETADFVQGLVSGLAHGQKLEATPSQAKAIGRATLAHTRIANDLADKETICPISSAPLSAGRPAGLTNSSIRRTQLPRPEDFLVRSADNTEPLYSSRFSNLPLGYSRVHALSVGAHLAPIDLMPAAPAARSRRSPQRPVDPNSSRQRSRSASADPYALDYPDDHHASHRPRRRRRTHSHGPAPSRDPRHFDVSDSADRDRAWWLGAAAEVPWVDGRPAPRVRPDRSRRSDRHLLPAATAEYTPTDLPDGWVPQAARAATPLRGPAAAAAPHAASSSRWPAAASCGDVSTDPQLSGPMWDPTDHRPAQSTLARARLLEDAANDAVVGIGFGYDGGRDVFPHLPRLGGAKEKELLAVAAAAPAATQSLSGGTFVPGALYNNATHMRSSAPGGTRQRSASASAANWRVQPGGSRHRSVTQMLAARHDARAAARCDALVEELETRRGAAACPDVSHRAQLPMVQALATVYHASADVAPPGSVAAADRRRLRAQSAGANGGSRVVPFEQSYEAGMFDVPLRARATAISTGAGDDGGSSVRQSEMTVTRRGRGMPTFSPTPTSEMSAPIVVARRVAPTETTADIVEYTGPAGANSTATSGSYGGGSEGRPPEPFGDMAYDLPASEADMAADYGAAVGASAGRLSMGPPDGANYHARGNGGGPSAVPLHLQPDLHATPHMGHPMSTHHGHFGTQHFQPHSHPQAHHHPQFQAQHNPQQQSQYNPQSQGQYNQQSQGQYNPRNLGQNNPQLYGQYNPQLQAMQRSEMQSRQQGRQEGHMAPRYQHVAMHTRQSQQPAQRQSRQPSASPSAQRQQPPDQRRQMQLQHYAAMQQRQRASPQKQRSGFGALIFGPSSPPRSRSAPARPR